MLGEHGGQLEDLSEQYGIDVDQIVDFSVNINPLGFPGTLAEVLRRELASISRYPDPECRRFRRRLADHLGLPEDHILVGNGCNELIHLIFQCYPATVALIVQPTFSEYRRGVRLAGGNAADHILKWQDNFQLDMEQLIREASRYEFLFLCNPNNPTGQVLSRERLLELVSSVPQTIVVVDEAFIDFVDDVSACSIAADVSSHDNLIVLRSMTKFFAIPGLRLGYMTAHPTLMKRLKDGKEPWSVNTLAQVAGEHLMDQMMDQTDYIKRTHQVIHEERSFLLSSLSRMKWLHVYPTAVNFLLVRTMPDTLTAGEVGGRLMEQGIAIRDCSNFVGLNKNFFRIGLKRRSENQKLIAALRRIGDDL